ncbi:MAG: hypothetical protein WCH99_12835 [Verrucomicrobiota bacterium]
MIYDTLQYVDAAGVTREVALALQNLAGVGGAVKLNFVPGTHAPGTFTITWAQPPESGIAIPFKSRCKVFFNRTSPTGEPDTFNGGLIAFQGRMTDSHGSAGAANVSMQITLSDLWWDLEKLTYQHPWAVIYSGTLAAPELTAFTWPDVVLFQSFPGFTYSPLPVVYHINTWQQIVDIINFAAGYSFGANAVQVQLGSAPEFTPVYVPWYPLRSAKCAEALKICLRAHPGVFTEVDYATTPPTLHFRNRAALTAVTLPYRSKLPDGTTHLASDLEPLHQLVPDAVRIYYKITGEFNGQPVVNFTSDFYPAINLSVTGAVTFGDPVGGAAAPYVKNGTPVMGFAAAAVAAGVTQTIACRPANTLLDLDYSADISGASVTETRKKITSNELHPASLALWESRVASLLPASAGGQIPDSGPGVLQLVNAAPYNAATNPKGIQILGDDGVDYSSSYAALLPYWTDDDVYAWFKLAGGVQVQAVKCTFKAYFTYVKNSKIGSVTYADKCKEHEHTFKLLLTNAPSDTYVLKQETSATEMIPAGLAENIFHELSDLQWKLRHEIIQQAADSNSVPTLIKPGRHKINLSGGDPDWLAINAAVERVSIEFYRTADNCLVARQSISCGPVDHLEPGYLVQLTNMFLNRGRTGIDANQRLSGNSSSNRVDLTSQTSGENSNPATALPTSMHFVFEDTDGSQTVLKVDSEKGLVYGI